MSHTLAANFSVIQNDGHSSGGGTLITFSGSQSIFLGGITPASLVSANFRIV